jgi:hypothetical protein
MKYTINVELGDLGMKTGVACMWDADGQTNILIDPSRLAGRKELDFVLDHELRHAAAHIKYLWEKEQRDRLYNNVMLKASGIGEDDASDQV